MLKNILKNKCNFVKKSINCKISLIKTAFKTSIAIIWFPVSCCMYHMQCCLYFWCLSFQYQLSSPVVIINVSSEHRWWQPTVGLTAQSVQSVGWCLAMFCNSVNSYNSFAKIRNTNTVLSSSPSSPSPPAPPPSSSSPLLSHSDSHKHKHEHKLKL